MILADTSVWIDYLRQGEPLLAEQLSRGNILMHGMVLGELAIGLNLKLSPLRATHEVKFLAVLNDNFLVSC